MLFWSMRKLSIIFCIFLLVILTVGIWSFLKGRSGMGYAAPDPGKVHVVATTYPLAEFSRNIGGEFVSVTEAVPTGVEPHDFEPTPKQVAFMLDADVFVMNGGGIDAWADEIASQVLQRGGQVVKMEEEMTFEEGDPHLWLDPYLAQDMVRYIRYDIIDADPDHRDEYLSQTDAYLTKLLELHQAFETGLQTCQLRDIIVAHDAFGYLGKRYSITVHPILGLSPEEEPSAQDLAELAGLARELGVKTVFFETLLSPKLAKTLASEIDGEIAILNPIEGLTRAQSLQGKEYVSLMRENLNALKSAMMCQ